MPVVDGEFEYYADVLQVPYDVTIADLQRAYEQTMLFLHPKNGGSAAMSQAIGNAYGALLKHLEEREAAEDERPASAVSMHHEPLTEDDRNPSEHDNAQPADDDGTSSFGALSGQEPEVSHEPVPSSDQMPRQLRKRIHRCQECGKSFRCNSDLRSHQRTHTDEKRIRKHRQQCGECGKMFRDGYDLREHQRTHNGEKPFECRNCGKKYSSRTHFNAHKRRHSKAKSRSGRSGLPQRPEPTTRLQSKRPSKQILRRL